MTNLDIITENLYNQKWKLKNTLSVSDHVFKTHGDTESFTNNLGV